MTKKGSTAKIAAIIVAVMLCVALLTTVLVACSGNTITFETNGGSAVDSVKKTVKQSPLTTKDGFKFDGWYTEKEFKTKVKFPYTAEGDVTLYAKWVEETDADRIQAFYNIFGSALEKSIGFVGSEQFGVDVNLGAMGVGLNIKANIDPNDLSKVAANIELLNGDASVMNIFADDEFLYLVNDTTKKRLKDFNLEAMLSGIKFDEFSTSSYGTLIGTMLNLVLAPESSTYNKEGNTYTVEGSLAGISELLGGLNIEGFTIPAEVTDLLAGMNLRIKTTIENDSIKDLAITVVTPLGEVAITSNQLKLGNGVVPAITLPSPTDNTFDETYGLNFTVNGNASLISVDPNFVTSSVTNLGYEIRVDYNIFGVLRDATGGDKTGVEGIFGKAAQDSKIFIDVFHTCNQYCGTFCDTKIGDSRGSFLTLAYSPQDFKSNNFFVSINPKYLLPKGLLNYATGIGAAGDEGLDNVLDNFGEYMAISLDPSAVLASLSDDGAAVSQIAATAGFDIGSLLNPNILDVIANVFNFVKTINYNDSLTIGVPELLGFIDSVSHTDATNIATILSYFLGEETTALSVSAVAEFGDKANVNMDVDHKFMTISPSIGDYKNFVGVSDFTPAKNITWSKDKNNNVKLKADGVQVYDETGKALPLSAGEVEKLLTTGSAEYSYTKLNGATGTTSTKIISVTGIDYKKVGVPQKVTVITAPADGDALTGILTFLSDLIPGGLNIPGAMFTTTITITELSGDITLTQDSTNMYGSNYDPAKEYSFLSEMVNPNFTATVTYAGGVKKTFDVLPVNVDSIFSNNTAFAQYASFADEEMIFDVAGVIIKKPIKAKKDQLTNNKEKTSASINTGGTYTIESGARTVEYGDSKTDNETVKARKSTTKIVGKLDPSISVYDTYAGSGAWKGLELKFAKAGTYTLEVYIGQGFTEIHEITVTDAIVVPGYTANVKYIANDTIRMTIGRTNQIGGNINAKLQLKIGGAVLTAGDDFKLVGTASADTLFLNANQAIAQVFEIKLLNANYIKDQPYLNDKATVTLTAPDLKDAVIFEAVSSDMLGAYKLATKSYEMRDNAWANTYQAIELRGIIADSEKLDFSNETLSIKFEVKAAGANDFETIAVLDHIAEYGTPLPEGTRAVFTVFSGGSANTSAEQNLASGIKFDFSKDGKLKFNGLESYIYILIKDPDLRSKGFEYKVSVEMASGLELSNAKASGTVAAIVDTPA